MTTTMAQRSTLSHRSLTILRRALGVTVAEAARRYDAALLNTCGEWWDHPTHRGLEYRTDWKWDDCLNHVPDEDTPEGWANVVVCVEVRSTVLRLEADDWLGGIEVQANDRGEWPVHDHQWEWTISEQLDRATDGIHEQLAAKGWPVWPV